jgi:hypothetical protein
MRRQTCSNAGDYQRHPKALEVPNECPFTDLGTSASGLLSLRDKELMALT